MIVALALPSGAARGQTERLDRGVVAVVQPDGRTFISWRLLADDPDDTTFHVYRATGDASPQRLTREPITAVTWFVDENPDLSQPTTYSVRAVVRGEETPADGSFTLPADAKPRPYLSIPLETPEGYTPNDCSAADLDGDGRYDLVVHQTGRGRDNGQGGVTDPPILQGYTLAGKKLWTINLGRNIREGAHYTQFMVYDLDGDGVAEIVCKTADGTVDGVGKVIGDADANHVNDQGRILTGPEYLTVFDGRTGKALATTDYVPPRHPTKSNPTGDELQAIWGDGYGNRCDRFLACVAYLDGQRPSVVMCRGYYTRTVLAAWDWRDGKLTLRWVFDSNTPGNETYAGQGNHNLSVADVDGDGRDEIIYGGMTIDDDGRGLYSTRLGHGDALHVSDLDPTRPGLEIFRIQEPFSDAGSHLLDARTGEVLWRRPSVSRDARKGQGPGRGLAADIDPRYPGAECWSYGGGITGTYSAQGKLITEKTPPSCNFAVWWDGDETRELLDKTFITKWDPQTESVATLLDSSQFGCRSINGTKANPALSADLLGDWREEVIWPTDDGKELRLFTTTIPTHRRMVTLMQDRQYRLAIAWQNVGYNQPPHPSFFIGADTNPNTPRPAP
jgi:rhamnogalacturonan endolyase